MSVQAIIVHLNEHYAAERSAGAHLGSNCRLLKNSCSSNALWDTQNSFTSGTGFWLSALAECGIAVCRSRTKPSSSIGQVLLKLTAGLLSRTK